MQMEDTVVKDKAQMEDIVVKDEVQEEKENTAAKDEQSEEKEVYSYHTFLFPFLWKRERNQKDEEEFVKFLEDPERSYWKPYEYPIFHEELKGEDEKVKKLYEEAQLNYSVYQYFNEPAQTAISGRPLSQDDTERVRNYQFLYEEMAEHNGAKPTYEIKCKVERRNAEGKAVYGKRNFILDINNITLRLYPVGVAILVYELENRNYRTLDDVKDINDYGRRIQLACLDAGSGFKLTADSITVCGIKEDFSARVQEFAFENMGANPWKKGIVHLSNTVLHLFQHRDVELVELAVSLEQEEGKLYFEPSVDDRMFVMCLISDSNILPCGWGQYEGISDLDGVGQLSLESLYELIYVDPAHNRCCYSRQRIKEELENSIYDRWIEYGTLYGITQYSMICVTGFHEYVGSSVINPFLTIYKELVQLVMVQRTAIIMFAEMAAVRSKESQLNKEEAADNILEMQKDYVAFQNQLLLFEVTSQLQGIQIYQMLQEKMEISSQEQEMEKQLQNLYEISQTESGDRTNTILNVMTVFGLLFTGIQVVQQQLVEKTEFNTNPLFYLFGYALIAISIYQNGLLTPKGEMDKKDKLVWVILGVLMVIMLGYALLDTAPALISMLLKL